MMEVQMGEIDRRVRKLEIAMADALEAGNDELLNEILEELVFYTIKMVTPNNRKRSDHVL